MLCQEARERRRGSMSTQRQQYSAEFKARVALEALKGLKTVNALASTYGVHPTQIAHWKPRLHKEMPEIFSARRAKRVGLKGPPPACFSQSAWRGDNRGAP